MGFETTIQQAIFDRLSTYPALSGVPVLDDVPQGQGYPYITISESLASDWSTATERGHDDALVIHTWSRYAGAWEVKQLQGHIEDALTWSEDELSTPGYKVLTCEFVNSDNFLDSDALTRHGVQTFRLITERI